MLEIKPITVPIEALKIDIRFGLEDKKDQLYNIAFSFRDGRPYKWNINVNYAAFQELNRSISTAGSHILSSEFPKAHRSRSAFRMKLPQELLDQRRNDLTLWLREVTANYDLLPPPVQNAVIRFFKVPPEYDLKFTTKDLMSDGSRSPTSPQSPIVDSTKPRDLQQPQQQSTLKIRRPSGSNMVRRPSLTKTQRQSFSRPSSITSLNADEIEEELEFGTPLEHDYPSERRNPKVYRVYSLFLNVLELVEILMHSVSFLHTRSTTNQVLCISRTEALIEESMAVKPILRQFLEELFSVFFFGVYCALLCCVVASATLDDYLTGDYAGRLLNVSIIALCVMLYHDQYLLHCRNLETHRCNTRGFDRLQYGIDKFIGQQPQQLSADIDDIDEGAVLYREYLAPFFGMSSVSKHRQHTASKRSYGRKLMRGSGLLLQSFRDANTAATAIKSNNRHGDSEDERESFADVVRRGVNVDASSAIDDEHTLTRHSLTDNGTPEQPDQPHAVTTDVSESVPVIAHQHVDADRLKHKLAMRRAFDDFVFPGISPQAAAMFIDRRYTHNFQVRGANYLTDKKKIHPGSAMCKLMLLELYEVDPTKDGDRHDHIASRGLCRSRRETIAALPGSPFQILINFQIPGDPPVSVVAYFAVPPDLAERFDPSEVEVFQSLLSQFINLPASECERLAAWGVVSSSGNGTTAAASAGSGGDDTDDSEGETSATAVIEPKSPTTAAATADTSKGSWFKMPSDIRWPDPHEPGALPQSDFRNLRFKLIPSVTEGPWVVKAAVRSQPALLGRKVVQRYFRGEGYMEIDIHVGSSGIAMNVVGVCRGYTKMAAADLGIVIQGEHPSELPEKMLGCVCFNHIDMEVRHKLD